MNQELRDLLNLTYESDDESGQAVRKAMNYRYKPDHEIVHMSLSFDVILNPDRQRYIEETMSKLNQSKQQAVNTPQDPNRLQTRGKRTLCPHVPPPHDNECPFDRLDSSTLTIRSLSLNGRNYAIVVNSNPWGYHHFMMVTIEQLPQQMT